MDAAGIGPVARGEAVRIGELTLRFRVEAPEMTMFEFTVPPAAKVPAPHFHETVDEAIYGLSGTLTVTAGGERRELRAGEACFIPRGMVHHHANLHDEPAHALVVMTPGSISRRYFEELAQVINGPGRPDMAAVQDIMRRHGLVPAPGLRI